ncbi:MAG TPA: hypothetical protein VGI92_03275 [Gemmatimonadales bacterium]|jgi:predicted metalloprotease with PDZ domain
MRNRLAYLVLALACAGSTRLAAQEVSYDISFANAVHHEARVAMTVTGVHGRPVIFRMSASSPGRYALTGFGKNVYDLSAVDGHNTPLTIVHIDPDGWSVAPLGGTITLRYTVFGDRGDGTYMQVDDSHAHLNMPAAFMWARGFESHAIRVQFHIPDGSGWRIATQLFPTSDATTFTAPNLNYFMDSPTELSAFTERTWQVSSGGHNYTLRLAIHHLGTEAEADSFASMAKRVVDQEIAVFGETPAYDPGTYTFIADYLPWVTGDGMEHRNSTILASTSSLATSAQGLLGTLSHEYFHSWNMKRIRSRAIEPFDFARANMSDELWEGEGFTQYYGVLLLRRAGFGSVGDYARGTGGVVNAVVNSPGRRFFGPVGMSQMSPWVDGAATLDATNTQNTFISYYTWGAAVALALDLTLREQYPGKTLDGYMRELWAEFGKPGVWYTMDGLQHALAVYSGDATFARNFYARYIIGNDVPDYAPLLAKAGFLLRRASPDAATLGNTRFSFDARGGTIQFGTQIGTPLYDAGLDRGDHILTVDGRPFTGDSVWSSVRAEHHPGDVIPVEVESRGAHRTVRLTAIPDPRLEVVTNEDAGQPVTPEMLALRRAWLGSEH